MKRLLAGLGLVAVAIGTPAILNATAGTPALPATGSFGGLDSTYLPLEPVLGALALAAWALWAYLVVAVLLRALALVVAQRTGRTGLVQATDRFAPRPLRRWVDVAVGGVFLASSLSVGRAVALPPPAPAIAAVAPAVPAPAKPAPAKEVRRYVVRPGDSLWAIAERELGSGFRWKEIFRENKSRQFPDGRCLENPRLIHPGWDLRLPTNGAVHEPKAEPPRTTPPRETPPSSPAGEATVAVPASTPEAEPTPTPEPTVEPSTSEPEPERVQAEPPATPDAAPRPTPPVVRLPSGAVIAASFACGLLSAELLTRLRRRRARRPLATEQEQLEMPERLVRDLRHAGAAPTAAPIDVAIDEVLHVWHAHTGRWPRILGVIEGRRKIDVLLDAPQRALPKPSGGQLSPAVRFERTGSVVKAEVRGPFPLRLRRVATPMQRGLLAPLGHAGSKTAVHVGLLGAGAISVEGAEGNELVRQMILSLATEASTDDLQLVILGQSPPTIGDLPHVWQRADWVEAGDAIQEIQAEFIRRARLFQREGIDDITDHLAEHGDEHLPGILIVAVDDPPAPMCSVLDAIAQEAPRFGAATLAIGWRPTLLRIHIVAEADALAVESGIPIPSRLAPFTLDEETVRDAERLIRQVAVDEANEDSGDGSDSDAELGTITSLHVSSSQSPDEIPSAQSNPVVEPTTGVVVTPVPPPGMAAIHCLGHLRVTRDGKSRSKGWHSKARELLAYLVAHPEGATKERICADLWPDENDSNRLQNLFNKALYNVRCQVRNPDDAREYVVRNEDTIRLEVDAWWVDAFVFARLIDYADHRGSGTLTSFRQAVALYRDDFCADTYFPWVEAVRERYRTLFTGAAARLAQILRGAAQNEDALSVLERAIDADLLCEDLWRQAMIIEAALGRRGAVLERFRRLRELLSHELGMGLPQLWLTSSM